MWSCNFVKQLRIVFLTSILTLCEIPKWKEIITTIICWSSICSFSAVDLENTFYIHCASCHIILRLWVTTVMDMFKHLKTYVLRRECKFIFEEKDGKPDDRWDLSILSYWIPRRVLMVLVVYPRICPLICYILVGTLAFRKFQKNNYFK